MSTFNTAGGKGSGRRPNAIGHARFSENWDNIFKKKDEKEIITGVAIKIDSKVHSLPAPNRHHNLIYKLYEENGHVTVVGEQGFITNKGRFVNREEALIIAKEAEQLLDRHQHATELFSESVW